MVVKNLGSSPTVILNLSSVTYRPAVSFRKSLNLSACFSFPTCQVGNRILEACSYQHSPSRAIAQIKSGPSSASADAEGVPIDSPGGGSRSPPQGLSHPGSGGLGASSVGASDTAQAESADARRARRKEALSGPAARLPEKPQNGQSGFLSVAAAAAVVAVAAVAVLDAHGSR